MKKVVLTKGHLNQIVEKMIKESGGYDSPDRKAKFRSDIDDEMAPWIPNDCRWTI